ncbi:flavonoid 3'-monooxygenase isoform X1 [Selaginella moellendorffii]|nr:flavonoid 3'-monooxygenase isoform X1 [Selaginella moellendorffii]|eukprot:XP_002966530.2 flavonoid 3'-monooxygenase isoform X1 [Selaginella moellendorffii]
MFWAVHIVVFLLTAFILKQWLSSISLNLPPGPRGLPLIGHFHLLAMGKIPHIALQQLSKRFGPLFHLRLGSVPVFVVSSPEMAKEFLKNHDTEFAYRPRNNVVSIVMDSRSMSFSPYGDYWKKLRKLCATEIFTAKRMSMNTQIIRDELWELSGELLRASKAGQVVGVRPHLRALSFNVMTRILMKKTYFGSKASGDPAIAAEASNFIAMIDEILEVGAAFSITDYFPYLSWLDLVARRAKVAGDKMNGFLQKVLDEQRPGEVPDFVEVTRSHIGNDLVSLRALLMDLLLGGSETSSTVTEWALAELLHHPDWMVKAQQEIESVVGRTRMVEEGDISKLEVLNAIIKESFRLHPPVSLLIPHASVEAQNVAGYDISKNAMLIVNVYAIGRDPRVWSDPLEFQPQRFIGSSIGVNGQDFELLPFGSGKRACPGLHLGLRNVQLVLSNLLHGFEWKFPGSPKDQTMDEAMGNISFMAHTLKAKITPRLNESLYRLT